MLSLLCSDAPLPSPKIPESTDLAQNPWQSQWAKLRKAAHILSANPHRQARTSCVNWVALWQWKIFLHQFFLVPVEDKENSSINLSVTLQRVYCKTYSEHWIHLVLQQRFCQFGDPLFHYHATLHRIPAVIRWTKRILLLAIWVNRIRQKYLKITYWWYPVPQLKHVAKQGKRQKCKYVFI